jgi:hypothetical protein
MDSCLLFDKAAPSISVTRFEGPEILVDEHSVPGYEIFTPTARSVAVKVGYATSKRGSNDFVFAGRYRGYIRTATALGAFKAERIESPSLAFYAVLREGPRQYLCVVESAAQGSAAFVRSAFVAAFPPKGSRYLALFYQVADVRQLKAFGAGATRDGN